MYDTRREADKQDLPTMPAYELDLLRAAYAEIVRRGLPSGLTPEGRQLLAIGEQIARAEIARGLRPWDEGGKR